MASLLEMTHRDEVRLKPETQKLLIQLLRGTTTGGRRLKAGLPPKTPLWHKTGTGPRIGGINLATNDVGVFTLPDGSHVAVAVLVKSGKATDPVLEKAIAQIAATAVSLAAAGK